MELPHAVFRFFFDLTLPTVSVCVLSPGTVFFLSSDFQHDVLGRLELGRPQDRVLNHPSTKGIYCFGPGAQSSTTKSKKKSGYASKFEREGKYARQINCISKNLKVFQIARISGYVNGEFCNRQVRLCNCELARRAIEPEVFLCVSYGRVTVECDISCVNVNIDPSQV
jgi:hypothetical protein